MPYIRMMCRGVIFVNRAEGDYLQTGAADMIFEIGARDNRNAMSTGLEGGAQPDHRIDITCAAERDQENVHGASQHSAPLLGADRDSALLLSSIRNTRSNRQARIFPDLTPRS